jgi:hypothetical protein
MVENRARDLELLNRFLQAVVVGTHPVAFDPLKGISVDILEERYHEDLDSVRVGVDESELDRDRYVFIVLDLAVPFDVYAESSPANPGDLNQGAKVGVDRELEVLLKRVFHRAVLVPLADGVAR